MADVETWDLGGAYRRDLDGIWRDARDGTVIAGASDLTLADLYEPPLLAGVRSVPRRWARRHPDHPLAWVFAHAASADVGTREPIAVPAEVWDRHAARPVAMTAPELHPHNLIGVDGVAELIGVAAATVRAYVTRGQMPAPVVRIGGAPVWPRALIERWLSSRPRSSPLEPIQTPPTGGMSRSR